MGIALTKEGLWQMMSSVLESIERDGESVDEQDIEVLENIYNALDDYEAYVARKNTIEDN